jgi:energy-coupling factor transporter ATP-binding protein EcfA2
MTPGSGARRQARPTLIEGCCWRTVARIATLGRGMARIVRDRRSAVNAPDARSSRAPTPALPPRSADQVQRDRNAIRRPEACRAGSSGHPERMAAPSSDLRVLVDRLTALAERRLAIEPTGDGARARAVQLRDHAAGHLRVRAASLDSPLLVLLLGPTGAGKSSLFNAIAGRRASPSGVLRPTTRTALVLASPGDLDAVRMGALAGIPADRLDSLADPALAAGVALVDAPDVDSIDHANRALADKLVEAADLCLFVTTATRYADRVPWAVLARVAERGLPLVVVVNRLPAAESDRAIVLDDVRRLFDRAGFGPRLEIVGIEEGALDPANDALDAGAAAPVRARIEALRADADARRQLAADALAGSLAGVGPLIDRVADDVAHDEIDVAALRRTVEQEHRRALAALRADLAAGTFLRDEALRHWQGYVGADDITRLFSRGIGALRGALAAVFRPSRAPVAEVREATTDDLVGVVEQHASEAARRTATAWADEARVAAAVADRPDLWTASPGLDERVRGRLDDWIASIGADFAATGESRRRLARGASIGVNALGVGVMLATFIHTAGLTGTEVGVAAATAFLNQKLLSALFGEAAMVELIGRARSRLDEVLDTTFAEERARFESLVPPSEDLAGLGAELRALADDIRAVAPTAGATTAGVSPQDEPPEQVADPPVG